jgi:aspartate kinase
MIIMKFGGTSVEDAPSIERVVEIIRARLELKPVVVVSAMGKTTRGLLEAAEASASGSVQKSLSILARLESSHRDETARLAHHNAEGRVFRQIEQYFEELTKLLEGLAILGEVPPRGLDKILSYGEQLSSAILVHALNQRGLPSFLLDARELIKTDDNYGGASPIFEITNPRIREAVVPLVKNGLVPIVQGFIGSTRSGATTTLGFEGSDYTAAILGAALSADDIQIWKDVSGIMTADPAIFPGGRTVKACSYTEAAELTYFGAKVLHPNAIHPAARSHIPIHIYNSRRPAATGTAITAGRMECSNPIKSIAYRRPVTIITAIQDPAQARRPAPGRDDFLKQMLEGVRRQGVDPFITALSSSSVTLAVASHGLDGAKVRDLIENISSFASASAEENRALVTLVGEGLRCEPAGALGQESREVGKAQCRLQRPAKVEEGLEPARQSRRPEQGREARSGQHWIRPDSRQRQPPSARCWHSKRNCARRSENASPRAGAFSCWTGRLESTIQSAVLRPNGSRFK